MNKKPVWYLQYDKRWRNVPYAVRGKENGTIRTSGCGPTSAAMLLATLVDPNITPVDCAKWSMDHGYKWVGQGTAYAYFVPQFAAYGIRCVKAGKDHDKVKQALSEGWYAIAVMGPGTWTKGGHYIVVWDWDDKVRINDSASTNDKRLNGDPATFKKEVKHYWLIDASAYNRKDDSEMEEKKIAPTGDNPSKWAREATEFCKQAGIFNGDGEGNYGWQQPITREAVAQVIYNVLDKLGLLDKIG